MAFQRLAQENRQSWQLCYSPDLMILKEFASLQGAKVPNLNNFNELDSASY